MLAESVRPWLSVRRSRRRISNRGPRTVVGVQSMYFICCRDIVGLICFGLPCPCGICRLAGEDVFG